MVAGGPNTSRLGPNLGLTLCGGNCRTSWAKHGPKNVGIPLENACLKILYWTWQVPHVEAIRPSGKLDPSWGHAGQRLSPCCGGVGSNRWIWTMLCGGDMCKNYRGGKPIFGAGWSCTMKSIIHSLARLLNYHALARAEIRLCLCMCYLISIVLGLRAKRCFFWICWAKFQSVLNLEP
jgi:hypothetical protein